MSILVLGGTGFIGPRAIQRLVARGEHVVCMDINPDTASFAELSDPFALECDRSVFSGRDYDDERLPDRSGRSGLVMPNLVYSGARDACCKQREASGRCQPRIQTSLHSGLREPYYMGTK